MLRSPWDADMFTAHVISRNAFDEGLTFGDGPQ